MTKKEELQTQSKKDEAYLAAAIPVWEGPVKDFAKGYSSIQHLYNGTSFQKKHYPENYQKYIKTEPDY